MPEEEPCGNTWIIAFSEITPTMIDEGIASDPVVLVCSRPWGHTPANEHSDGVNDWEEDV